MGLGKLNSKVAIMAPGTVQDDIGQPGGSPTLVARVWASILLPRGVEVIRADRDVSIVPASIRIRHRSDVDATMEVHVGATVYKIKAVLPDEQDRKFDHLVCEVVHV